ncbi:MULTISPECIES: MerR family transcriptional regulator [Amycolatopsis]|uniref:MerR family transcriptional regulator n=1 Tax=Amycolatopsis TaxID=1813 RepID=UPI000B8A7C75|nr:MULTISPECIES: MerR family transcriptional regulator [Amycolatopsis]OXM73023.1 MerR family transcriptional regulator [Amycolatopsis sp. KNN50.9b]
MLIGELGRRTGVNTHQLRYYEAQGLLKPDRGANGYREYGEDAVVTVTQIRNLLDAGLSTEEIGVLLPCASGAAPDLEPCDELLAVLRGRLHGLDDHIGTLLRARQTLHGYLEAAEHRRAGETAPV